MAMQADGAGGGEFLGWVLGVVMKPAGLATKKRAKTSAKNEKDNVEDNCHSFIVPLFIRFWWDACYLWEISYN